MALIVSRKAFLVRLKFSQGDFTKKWRVIQYETYKLNSNKYGTKIVTQSNDRKNGASRDLGDAIDSIPKEIEERYEKMEGTLEHLMSCCGWQTIAWDIVNENADNQTVTLVSSATITNDAGREFEISGNWNGQDWGLVSLHEWDAEDDVDRAEIAEALGNRAEEAYTAVKLGVSPETLANVADAIEMIVIRTGEPGAIECPRPQQEQSRGAKAHRGPKR